MQQYELNLRDYIRIFHKRKLAILGTFFVVLSVAFYSLSRQPYVYEASTTVKIEERKSIAGLLTEWILYNPKDVMESETKIIKGFPIMQKVAKKLALIGDNVSSSDAQRIVSGLQRRIQTKKIENTNIIEIRARGNNPRNTMELANLVASVYIEQNLLEKSLQARVAKQFIAEQLSKIEARLRSAERKLKDLSEKTDKLKEAEPIRGEISKLRFELRSLLQKYTEKHPTVIQIKEQIKELEATLESNKDSDFDELEFQRLSREVEANRKIYGMLKEKLEEARITEAQKVSDISVVDPAVLPGVPVEPNKRMGLLIGAILGLIMGVTLAFFFETIDPSIGTIEDVENVVKLPVLGIVPSIHAELENTSRWPFSFFRRKQTLTSSEKDKEKERYVRLFVHHKPDSLVAESFRNIQANLKINDTNNKVFLVTSSGAGEGKTTCVINLGLICAQSGLKTLLISSDLRRPAIAKAFGLKREPGLIEYVESGADYKAILRNVSDMVLGEMEFDEILKFPGIENISVITSGALSSNPTAILSSQKVPALINTIKKDFDVILMDCPPVLPIADASILAPLADSVVLVYEVGKIARQALMRSKIQIESSGVRIAGVVLNNIKPQTESIAPYYYKYKYHEEAATFPKDKET